MTNLSASMLQRMPLLAQIAGTRPLGDLADRAARILGYTVLKRPSQSLELRQTLNIMEVRPFTRESVEKYMQAIKRKADYVSLFPGRAEKWLSLVTLIVGLIVGLFISSRIGIIIAPAGFGAVVLLYIGNPDHLVESSWKAVPLEGYPGVIPEPILRQAAEIKEELPGVEFRVHQFVRQRVVQDPFLSVCYGDDELFLDVWDESEFVGKR